MSRVFLSILILASSAAAFGAADDDAFRDAKDEYQKLKDDKKRRALRHHWQNVAEVRSGGRKYGSAHARGVFSSVKETGWPR